MWPPGPMTAIVAAVSLVAAPPARESGSESEPESESESVPESESESESESVSEPEPESESVSAPRPDRAAAAAAASGAIGGYDDAFDLRGRPPRDGEDEILAGSIVFPLGLIGVASSGAQLWLSIPGHCQSRWASVGSTPTASQCRGIYAFSIVRVVHSGLMAAAGGVLLGIGLHRRKRYKDWKRGVAWMSRVSGSPWFTRTGAGFGIVVRFGAPG